MTHFLSRLAPALALCLPLLAVAQQRADAVDTKGTASTLRYRSAFADYKPWQDIPPGHWQQLNDDVAPASGRAGGHAAHGVGSATPAASAPAATAHQGHEMHRMQGGKK